MRTATEFVIKENYQNAMFRAMLNSIIETQKQMKHQVKAFHRTNREGSRSEQATRREAFLTQSVLGQAQMSITFGNYLQPVSKRRCNWLRFAIALCLAEKTRRCAIRVGAAAK